MSLQSAILRAESTLDNVHEMISGYPIEDNTKKKMIAGLLSLIIEHYESIILLIKNKKHGSASALARPLFEGYYRITWLALSCSDEKAERLNLNDSFPSLSKIAKDIDVVISGGSFQYVYDKNKSTLHGYTHGGMHQIARRINEEGDITTAFNDDELEDLLKVSGGNLLLACMGFFSGVEDLEKATLAQQYIKEYFSDTVSPNSSPSIT